MIYDKVEAVELFPLFSGPSNMSIIFNQWQVKVNGL